MEPESHGLLDLPMGKKAICINSPGGSLGGLSGDVPVTKNPWGWLFLLERATMEAALKI